ncbi:phage tail protein [Scandinavium goeteborgense]|uniref:phage tail protein n=1 Tax=Scandinavium goeteborgense TaxID=1851514 RepID=UPI001573C84D|nr:phage tail protein [Scandinavium goeteborgense]QKN82183.1 phage tail protein [Scandinavium goeteborgense]
MSDYYLLITDAGKALEVAAHASGAPVSLTDFAVGDGGGSPVTPDATQTALTNETFRDVLSSLSVSVTDASVLEAECIIPASSGGYTLREIGIFASDGTLYAVGNFAEQEKPAPDSGYAASLKILADLVVSDTRDITLTVQDGSYLTVTQADTIYLRQDKRLGEIAGQGADAQTEARENIGCGTVAAADLTASRSDTTAGRVLQVGDYGQGSTTGTTQLSSIFDITCTEIRSAIGAGGGANATKGMPENSENTRFSVNIYSVYASQFWVELISTKQTYTGMVYTDTKDPVSWTQHYTDHYKPAASDCDAVSASQGGTFQKVVNFNGGLNVLQNNTGIYGGNDAAGFTSDNLLLKSWYGIGFYCTENNAGPEIGITGYINTRTGRLEMKEQIIPGNYGNFDARYQKVNTASKAGNGWFKDTNTGLIIQFGHGNYTKNSRITFPVAFPNACVGPVGNDSGTGLVGVSLGAFDKTGFTMYAEEGSVSLSWIAIGY